MDSSSRLSYSRCLLDQKGQRASLETGDAMFPSQPQSIKYTYANRSSRPLPPSDGRTVNKDSPSTGPPPPSRLPSPGPSQPSCASDHGLRRHKAGQVTKPQEPTQPVTPKDISPGNISCERASRQRRARLYDATKEDCPTEPLPSGRDLKPTQKPTRPRTPMATQREVKPIPKRTTPSQSTAAQREAKTLSNHATPRRLPVTSALAPNKPSGLGPLCQPILSQPRLLKRSVSLGDQEQSLSIDTLGGKTACQPSKHSDLSPNPSRRNPGRSTSRCRKSSASLQASASSNSSSEISRTSSSLSLGLPKGPASGQVEPTGPLPPGSSAKMTINDTKAGQVAGPKDLSDIFSVLENDTNRTGQNKPLPKRRRVSQIGTRSLSTNGVFSPPHSPALSSSSAPNDPTSRTKSHRLRAPRLACDLEAPEHPTQLFLSAGRTGRAISRHMSSELLSLPAALDTINCANLAAVLATDGSIKRTYGVQRTFKDDDDEVNMLLPMDSDVSSSSAPRPSSVADSRHIPNARAMKPRETYSDLRKKWGVDEDEETTDSHLDLRTISDQRTMGSSKRFVDELSYLFEGLSEERQIGDLDFKRLGALELVRKLTDQEFIKNLKTNGMIEQFYDALRSAGAGDGDMILDLMLLVFISILCHEDQRFLEPVLRIVPKNSTDPLSTQSDCLQVLAKVINAHPRLDSLAGHDAGLGKRESQLLADVAQIIKKSPLGKRATDSPQPSAIMLALISAASISAFLPRPGLLPQRAIIQSGAYRAILKCLAADADILKGLLEAYARGSDLLTPAAVWALHRVNSCVDVIEACTICEEEGMVALDHDRHTLASCFVSLVPLGHVLATQRDQTSASQGLDILISCLRTMVNATNYGEDWADLLTTPALLRALCGTLNLCREGYTESMSVLAESGKAQISDDHVLDDRLCSMSQGAREIVFDLICVTLGLLANLFEQSSRGKEILRNIYIHGPGLSAARECCLGCQCTGHVSALEELVELYLQPPSASLAEVEFVRGSVCMLFNLCLDVQLEEEVGLLEEAVNTSLDRRAPGDRQSGVMESLLADLIKWGAQSSKEAQELDEKEDG